MIKQRRQNKVKQKVPRENKERGVLVPASWHRRKHDNCHPRILRSGGCFFILFLFLRFPQRFRRFALACPALRSEKTRLGDYDCANMFRDWVDRNKRVRRNGLAVKPHRGQCGKLDCTATIHMIPQICNNHGIPFRQPDPRKQVYAKLHI